MNYTIGTATEKDIQGITNLEAATFVDPWHYKSVQEVVEREHITTVSACMDGQVIGYIICYHIVNEGEIARVAVSEEFRGMGIGGRMMEFLFEEGNRHGLSEFSLEVRESNARAIGLYSKYGFVAEGRRKNYYSSPTEDGLVMWKRQTTL